MACAWFFWDGNKEQNVEICEGDKKAAKTFNHMNRFGRKLQRRLTRRTIAEAQALKQQGLDTIHCIIYLADLVSRVSLTFLSYNVKIHLLINSFIITKYRMSKGDTRVTTITLLQ